jgi:hypothetical protein
MIVVETVSLSGFGQKVIVKIKCGYVVSILWFS